MIPILVTSRLKEALKSNGIDPKSYGPAYGGESAGLDLYYCGEDTLWIMGNSGEILNTRTQEIVRLIPTGLHVALPANYVGLILDRGSISKTNLVRRAGVIDPGFTGEIFVNLVGLNLLGTNLTNKGVTIEPGDKLPVQMVVVPFIADYSQVSQKEWKTITSDAKRLEGQVGSSDTSPPTPEDDSTK